MKRTSRNMVAIIGLSLIASLILSVTPLTEVMFAKTSKPDMRYGKKATREKITNAHGKVEKEVWKDTGELALAQKPVTVRNPDGSTTTTNSDGSSTTTNRDGSTTRTGIPDRKHGTGGTRNETEDMEGRVTTRVWKDRQGRTLDAELTTYGLGNEKKVLTITYHPTPNGGTVRSRETYTATDPLTGDEIHHETRIYDKDGNFQTGGTMTETDANGRKTTSRWDPETRTYVEIGASVTPQTSTAPAPAQPPPPDERTAEVMLVNYPPYEFYLGFSHNRVDGGDGREGFNGFATSITGNVSRYVGPKVYYSFHTRSFEDSALDLSSRASIHQFLPGLHVQDNALEDGPVRPFAHFMAGVAHHRFSFDDGVGSFSDSKTGFAAVIGGGVDIRLNDRVDFRTQVDYNPNRIDGQWQHNVRAGFGIVVKFGGQKR